MEWLKFWPDQQAKLLYVDILVGKLLELQPDTNEATDAFCNDLYPVLDKITEICVTNGFRQVCSANLDGINVRTIKPLIMMRIIWNVYNHTKNCILLQNCELSGGGAFFNALVGAVRGFLPPFLRNMITLIPSENCRNDTEGDPSDMVSGLEQFAGEISQELRES
jgi:hypothetical protein